MINKIFSERHHDIYIYLNKIKITSFKINLIIKIIINYDLKNSKLKNGK